MVGRLVGDARDDVQPREVAARRVLGEVAEDVVEGDEDRELQQQRQAGRGRVDVVLPVELHQLFLLALAVGLVALLDLLHLRLVPLEGLHRVDLLHRERHEEHAHDHRHGHDRPGPGQADRPVEPEEDVVERVLERGDRAQDDHA